MVSTAAKKTAEKVAAGKTKTKSVARRRPTPAAVVQNPDVMFMQVLEKAVLNPDVDIDKMERLLVVQERIIDKRSEQAFSVSMMEAQKDMPIVCRDKENTQTHSRYSSYEGILKAGKPVYTSQGFSLMFYETDAPNEEDVRVCVDVMHVDGHTKKLHVDVPLDNTGMQGSVNKTKTHGKGSSFSYGRSYLMRMIFNIATGDDDDGNAAGGAPVIPLITDEELTLLRKTLTDAGIDVERFETWIKRAAKVDSLEELNANGFATAMQRAETMAKQMENDRDNS